MSTTCKMLDLAEMIVDGLFLTFHTQRQTIPGKSSDYSTAHISTQTVWFSKWMFLFSLDGGEVDGGRSGISIGNRREAVFCTFITNLCCPYAAQPRSTPYQSSPTGGGEISHYQHSHGEPPDLHAVSCVHPSTSSYEFYLTFFSFLQETL